MQFAHMDSLDKTVLTNVTIRAMVLTKSMVCVIIDAIHGRKEIIAATLCYINKCELNDLILYSIVY